MKIIFPLFIVFPIFVSGFSAEKGKADPATVDRLIAHSWAINELYLDSSTILAEKAVKIALEINYLKGACDAFFLLGYCMDRKGNFEQGIDYYSKAFKIQMQIGDSSAASAMGEIGYCYRKLGRLEDALKSFRMAVDIAKKYHDSAALCNNIHRIGICYHRKGDLQGAMDMYEEALLIAVRTKNKGIMLRCHHAISDIYSELGEYGIAMDYASRALAEALGVEDQREVAESHILIGKIFMLRKEYGKAKEALNKGLLIGEMISDLPRMERALIALGDICMENKQYDDALDHYTRAHLLSMKEKARAEEAKSLLRIGSVFLARGDFSRAAAFGEKAFRLAGSIQDLFIQSGSSELLWKAYRAMKDYPRALEYHERFKFLQDSISVTDFGRALVEKEMIFKMQADSLRFAGEQEMIKAVQRQKDFRQGILRYSILAGLACALFFLLVAYRQRNRISREKRRSDELLLNILPLDVAEEIKKDGHSKARTFSMVTVMFTDFKDFTSVSERVSAELLVAEIDKCFSAFDNIIQKHGVEKIKTVGDAYICVGGMPALTLTHATDILNAAIEIRDFMLERKKEQESKGGISFELRLGIHTGPVVAGIVGVKKYAYDIWGDTVNIAARMEQNSEAGKINISGSTFELVKDRFRCTYRGKIEAKNKGMIDMYFVESA